MGVRGLSKDLQEDGVGDEEEAGEDEPLLLQVATQGLLTHLQLLQQVGQQLAQRLVAHAALHHARHLVGTLHDLLPRLVDVLEALSLLLGGVISKRWLTLLLSGLFERD